MTQQILARHCAMESVKAGDLIEVSLDLILGNDLTTPVAIREFSKRGCKGEESGKVVIVMDLLPRTRIFRQQPSARPAESLRKHRGFLIFMM